MCDEKKWFINIDEEYDVNNETESAGNAIRIFFLFSLLTRWIRANEVSFELFIREKLFNARHNSAVFLMKSFGGGIHEKRKSLLMKAVFSIN